MISAFSYLIGLEKKLSSSMLVILKIFRSQAYSRNILEYVFTLFSLQINFKQAIGISVTVIYLNESER